jgi:hypothetical protein
MSLRDKFTENAGQFDALMTEMLAENDRLRKCHLSDHELREFINRLTHIAKHHGTYDCIRGLIVVEVKNTLESS